MSAPLWLGASDQYALASIADCADALASALVAMSSSPDRPLDPPRMGLASANGQLLVMPSTSTGSIGVKLVIHTYNGVPLRSLFKAFLEVEDVDENTTLIRASQSAVFSNWIPFKRQIEDLGRLQRRNVIVDLSDTKLVDHSTMERLEELREEFEHDGLQLSIIGLVGCTDY